MVSKLSTRPSPIDVCCDISTESNMFSANDIEPNGMIILNTSAIVRVPSQLFVAPIPRAKRIALIENSLMVPVGNESSISTSS